MVVVKKKVIVVFSLVPVFVGFANEVLVLFTQFLPVFCCVALRCAVVATRFSARLLNFLAILLHVPTRLSSFLSTYFTSSLSSLALRENLCEVPDISWDDVGGLEDVKKVSFW